jgi:phosphoglucosamine mutase
VAPSCIWELGADVVTLGVTPNGFNINDGVGSTHPQALQQKVLETRADIGIALDGDADRLIIVDEKGTIVDGDQLMGLITRSWKLNQSLRGGGLVATIMSNLGLQRFIEGIGLHMKRTQVGDRYVLEEMRRGGYNVGGEQSGHVILSDYATTGDGLVAALQVLAVIVSEQRSASEVTRVFEPLPQLLKNVRFNGGQPLDHSNVQTVIADAEKRLGNSGRLVIRKSGTEPLIRVMAEGEDEGLVHQLVDAICDAVKAAA